MKLSTYSKLFYEATKDVEYCCYCLEPRGAKYACCQENHFVPFSDLYEDDQEAIIRDEWEAAFPEGERK